MATQAALTLVKRPDGVVALTGVLGFETVTGALQASHPLLVPGAANRMDLAGVSRADSAGVTLLLEWVKRARKAGGSMAFQNMTAQLDALATACGVHELLCPEPVSGVEAANPAT